jgi:hypothetical protein
MAVGLTTSILDTFVNKGIKDICPYQYEKDGDNHCAHFVGHVLGLKTGETCAKQTVNLNLRTKYNAFGASIRVNEIFNSIGGGKRIDVTGAIAAMTHTVSPLVSTTAGAAAASASSGEAASIPTLTTTTGGTAAASKTTIAKEETTTVLPTECLIYAVLDGYVTDGTMSDKPSKHIGIYMNGIVWHYSNSTDKVVTYTLSQFSEHYGAGVTVLYYTDFPTGALAVEFATASISALPADSYIEGVGSNGHPEFKLNDKYKPKATPTPTPTASPFATPTPFATPGFKR